MLLGARWAAGASALMQPCTAHAQSRPVGVLLQAAEGVAASGDAAGAAAAEAAAGDSGAAVAAALLTVAAGIVAYLYLYPDSATELKSVASSISSGVSGKFTASLTTSVGDSLASLPAQLSDAYSALLGGVPQRS